MQHWTALSLTDVKICYLLNWINSKCARNTFDDIMLDVCIRDGLLYHFCLYKLNGKSIK